MQLLQVCLYFFIATLAGFILVHLTQFIRSPEEFAEQPAHLTEPFDNKPTLVIYSYFEADEVAIANLRFFLKTGVGRKKSTHVDSPQRLDKLTVSLITNRSNSHYAIKIN